VTATSDLKVDDTALAAYVLGLGDDALILAQRLGEWITQAPQIEEDIALGNIALDLLGQARTLLSYAGEIEGMGRDEDDLAFLRDEREFRNVHLVEIENGDFAVTMARQLIFSAYQFELYTALLTSTDPTLSALAGKAVKEVDYHRDHSTQWVLRLGDGTPESHHACRSPSIRSGRTSTNSSTPTRPSRRCQASRPTRPRSVRPGPTTSKTSSR
jgi:ring-1,2-phenylacetyl-CoA epoxidase subunit PaaC